MINDRSVQAVTASWWREHYRRPLSSSYSFGLLPHAVRWLLGREETPGLPPDVFAGVSPPYDTVVLCFLDAFSWKLAEQAVPKFRLLQRGIEAGVLSMLTAQFPSTTAAHVTTIHTGLTPAASGVYAWQYYEPAVGEIIEPLPYAYLGEGPGSLASSGIDPREIFPSPSLYLRLAEEGIRSFLVHPSEIVRSPANRIFSEGAAVLPYRSLAEALVSLRRVVADEPGPVYAQLYYDRIDALCHRHTVSSEEVEGEVEAVSLLFDHLLLDRLRPCGRTVLLITADHGHVETPASRTVMLNQEFPAVVPLLERGRTGKVLAPAGSRRDFFLHVRPPHLAEVEARLREGLAGRAEVVRTAELIEQGFFGPPPASQRLLDRVGNLVLLPRAGQAVWWQDGESSVKEAGGREKSSSHGGLSPQEMDIPLFVVPVG